jgi:mannitol-1-phosphate 5-dehydrogenase
MMASHVFTGFGFGPIQAGLFVKEAFQSGNFGRIVVAEIDKHLVDAVTANHGSYYVNVAKADGIEKLRVDNVTLLDPNVPGDRQMLLQVLAASTEIATCLPSVSFYDADGDGSVASLIADGLKNSRADGTIVYAAENHNRAAEILQGEVAEKIGALPRGKVQFLNTVIGKMSRVVSDPAEVREKQLIPITPGIERAFLVEEFNRILVTRTKVSGFQPGIEVFVEKDDLLPFEEAKLYGHNAIHAVLGFIGALKGYVKMTEVGRDRVVMQIGREAFLRESGAALVQKYGGLGDELFTEKGYKCCAEDLLQRMTNPYLADTIERVCRDVVRKLGLQERIFGTMQLALDYGVAPTNMAIGALAGIAVLLQNARQYNVPKELHCADWRKLDDAKIERIVTWLWKAERGSTVRRPFREHTKQLTKHVRDAQEHLRHLVMDAHES